MLRQAQSFMAQCSDIFVFIVCKLVSLSYFAFFWLLNYLASGREGEGTKGGDGGGINNLFCSLWVLG